MKTDSQIQTDVKRAINWDPSITHEHVVASVSHGVVTLSGSVPSYFEKREVEKVAQRVGGVRVVVQELEVKLHDAYRKGDQELADAILSQFKWNFSVPGDQIKVKVEKGWVELTGKVDWGFQKRAAERCINELIGVEGVSNLINIKAKDVSSSVIKDNIEEALQREARREAKSISVGVNGSEVTLSGNVHSISEMNDAKWAAWTSPGVTEVTNNMQVN